MGIPTNYTSLLSFAYWALCLQDDRFTGRAAAHIHCRIQLAIPLSSKPWRARLWRCPCCLCLLLVSDPSGLLWGWFHLPVQKSHKSYKFQFCRRHKMLVSAQRELLRSHCLSKKGHHISAPSPDIFHKRLRSKRTQPSDPEAVEGLPRPGSQRHGGPEFSFDLLPEARAIQVTIPPGPEVSVRLCHQWALECEELSSPFNAQKIVSGGHAVDLPYEFLLPCLCIEASYLQEDTVRRKKCPFQSWPEAYGSDFWKSVHFTDYSQHSQMVMALTLRCPLKLEASLCQRQGWHTLCEDLPNATVRESEGWYVLEKVDLHPQLCFKFSFGNSSHVECPHRTAPSWNVSMDTQAQQLILHFSSRTHATFSAAWSHPGLGQNSLVPPVYSVSQTHGSSPVTLDLILPFLRPGDCVLVWRSDVQFAWKRLLCPDVSHRRLGLLILALLVLTTLLVVVLVLTHRRPLSGSLPKERVPVAAPSSLVPKRVSLRPPSGQEWLRQGKGPSVRVVYCAVSGQEASGAEIQPELHLPSLAPWPRPLPGRLYLISPKAPYSLKLPRIPTSSREKELGAGGWGTL
ncbi:interleukin-17 receptor E isoform X5 [Diceros bicornis minor]|uniref:interleukin-17 receptor E isoform X5 n=1 Tax=Diceros bicornis minor TaxID=77932 RepID=UPI0026E98EEA|nr:interleukin-17 receptor E isoform X5 [Diceros bicornis minor]